MNQLGVTFLFSSGKRAESYLTQRLFRQMLGRIERPAGHPT